MNAYGNKFRYTKINGKDFDWLMHHEFGHEWWGNKVTAKDWADYWIHEGISTFGDALGHLRPYARGTASTPMRLWPLRLAGKRLGDEHIAQDESTPSNRMEEGPPSLAGLREALGRLPHRQQAVMSLALFEGLVPEEIAAASGLRLPRAMRQLRSALKRTGRYLDTQKAMEP